MADESESSSFRFQAAVEYPTDDLVAAVFANNAAVQALPEGYLLSFYTVFPPVVVGPNADEKLGAIRTVRAQNVARVLVSADQAQKLAAILQSTIEQHAKLMKEEADGK